MFILGIHSGKNANATLIKDNTFLAYCKEENISRKKNDGERLELKCIDNVLTRSDITRKDINIVVLSESFIPAFCLNLHKKAKKAFSLKEGSKDLSLYLAKNKKLTAFDIVKLNILRRKLDLSEDCEILFSNNLQSNILITNNFAISADPILHICCDFNINEEDTEIFYSKNELFGSIKRDIDSKTKLQNNGLPAFFNYALQFLNIDINTFECYSVMGENRLGDDLYDLFEINNGIISNKNNIDFLDLFAQFAEALSIYDFATSIQYAIEKVVFDFIAYWLNEVQTNKISLSGSLFANSNLIAMIANIEYIDEIFTSELNSQSYLSIGNCLFAHIAKNNNNPQGENVKDIHCGSILSREDLKFYIDKYKFYLREHSNIPQITAHLIKNNFICAVLDYNSKESLDGQNVNIILANASKSDGQQIRYDKLKQKSNIAFNSVVLESNINDLLLTNKIKSSKKMLLKLTDELSEQMPHIVRNNKTAMCEIIQDGTTLLSKILNEYKILTNDPCLINKSFLSIDEIPVFTPLQALKQLSDSDIDFIVFEKGLLFKDGF